MITIEKLESVQAAVLGIMNDPTHELHEDVMEQLAAMEDNPQALMDLIDKLATPEDVEVINQYITKMNETPNTTTEV